MAAAPRPDPAYRPTFRFFHNPLDICTAMMAAENPATLSVAALYDRLPSGWTTEMVHEAVLNWQSFEVLVLDEATGRIQLRVALPQAAPTQRSEAALVWSPIPPPPDEGGPARISLLSLFAGMGTDRLSLQRMLTAEGFGDRLGLSWFVEADSSLRAAVGRHLDKPTAAHYTAIATEVWQLVDPSHPAIGQLVRRISPRALLVIVAGSPCQGLTLGGPLRGRAGIASTASCHITAVFAIWHVLHALRPDLELHVVLENAGSMLPEFRRWIFEALGIDHLDHG